MNDISSHIAAIEKLIIRRLDQHFNALKAGNSGIQEPVRLMQDEPHPEYSFNGTVFTREEYCILLLAIIPHIHPFLLDSLVQQFLPNGGEFAEFGGCKTGNHRGMIPTGETAMFLLDGYDQEKRVKIRNIFSDEHFFYKNRILWLEEVKEGEPQMSGRIILQQEWLEQQLYGHPTRPRFSPEFPARLAETLMVWDDLVLHPQTRQQIDAISVWLKYNSDLMKDEILSRRLKPGYKVLFYGPPGTGKTLTATLLGKQFRMDVYIIDLSQVVSKFIGETEKNLEKIFSRAENKGWILFFDEADALFGKRTGVRDAHDKYANQEVSYLLQRVENFPGLVILASNYRNNIDQAFLRRFHQIIHFPAPDASERLLLWKKSLPVRLTLHEEVNLQQIAQKYELTGASILNAIQSACLQTLARHDHILTPADLNEGIRIEILKEEKTI